MSEGPAGWNDADLDRLLGNLLRVGVLLSAAVVALGGVYYLVKYGDRPVPDYSTFDPAVSYPDYSSVEGVPDELRSLSGVVRSAFHPHSRGIIQFGIIILIATPIARVLFSAFAFGLQRDATYVVVTLVVLAVLLYSLLTGGGA